MFMGRTVPSYRIATEMEIWKWRPFRKLLDKQDRKIFTRVWADGKDIQVCKMKNYLKENYFSTYDGG